MTGFGVTMEAGILTALVVPTIKSLQTLYHRGHYGFVQLRFSIQSLTPSLSLSLDHLGNKSNILNTQDGRYVNSKTQ